ncbi:MAG TPA: ABC transporter substrate-binding protein [Trueperaceae bacterium]
MTSRTRSEGRRRAVGALLLLLLLLAFCGAARAWELRVCAEPNNMPFSNRAEEGFENRIAEIVARQLGATLSYEWLPASPASDRLLYLRRGDCDMVVGVGDGTEGYLTTVTYYRSAPVFVYRSDAPFDVGSFDDPVLRELTIGVLAGAGLRPEVAALANRDLIANVVSFPWGAQGDAPLAAPVEAVAAGEVDIAVVWGPVGSYFGERHEVPLEVVSAEPKVDMPFLNLVVPMAMGVRQGDLALRDLLDRAIAGSWDEIQEVLSQYDVPLEPLPPQAPPATDRRAQLGVGLVLPLPTGTIPLEADSPEAAAIAAQMGALMAEEELGAPEESFPGLELLVSNAPNAASAGRAAERMSANGAIALVGGYGPGQAEALTEVGASRQVPFLNIGSSSPSLREECTPFTFHLEANAGVYLAALARSLAHAGLDDLVVAYPESSTGAALLEEFDLAASDEGLAIVAAVPVPGEAQLIEVALSAKEAEAEAVVALLDWRAQLDLAGFMGSVGEGIAFTGYPYPVTQTRHFYYSLGSLGPAVEAPRVALWEASLTEGPAGDLSQEFFARWGEPMDSPAWVAYLALSLVREAAASGARTGPELASSLEEVEIDSYGEGGAGFGPSDHQFRHDLVEVRVDSSSDSRQDAVSAVQRFSATSLPYGTGCR